MSADGNDLPDKPKHPGGRPTDYDPRYCEQVVEWGRQGKSRAWIAAEIGIAKSTLQRWESIHPEFSAAMERAKTLEQQWWEDAGQSGMLMQGFAQSVWSRSMAARFPDDWRERSDSNTTLNAGGELAGLLAKIAMKTVYPKDDERS